MPVGILRRCGRALILGGVLGGTLSGACGDSSAAGSVDAGVDAPVRLDGASRETGPRDASGPDAQTASEAGLPAEGSDGSLGDACSAAAACPPGATCFAEELGGWPGGTCVGFGCEVATNDGCPGDAQCLPATIGGGVCVDGCATDTDCRDAYRCESSDAFPTRAFCAPGCTEDGHCSGGRACNPALGVCDVPFDPVDLGEVCSAGRGGCPGGTCLREFETGFPDSYCVFVGCDSSVADDADGCPGDGVCIALGDTGITACVAGCDDAADCRGGYECRAVDEDDVTRGTGCLPACDDDTQCGNDGFVCDADLGLCLASHDP